LKDYIKPGLIILTIIISLWNFYFSFFTPHGNINTHYYVEDFKNYKKYYETACNEIIEIAKSNGFDVSENEMYYFCDIAFSKFCCVKANPKYTYYGYRKISNIATSCFEKIAESFPNYDHAYKFYSIYYSKDFISFTSKSETYSVVFSVNGKKPTDELNHYGEETKIRTKKIQKNWYHVWK
jgi:hypothetical protein